MCAVAVNEGQIQHAMAVWRQPSVEWQHSTVLDDQKGFFCHVDAPPSALKVHQSTQWPLVNSHFSCPHIIKNSSAHLYVRHFQHVRSIHYNISKRTTKGNGCENDMDRVSRQSLKMELILTWSRHVQSLRTISQHPDGLQQQKLAHCIRNRLVDNPVE